MYDLHLPAWLAWLLIAGAAAGALSALAVLAVKTGRGLGWLTAVAREAIGNAAAEALDGTLEERVHGAVDERIATAVDDLEAKLTPALAELLPNGGQSIKDQVTQLARDHGRTASELTAVRLLLSEHIQLSSRDREALWVELRDLLAQTDQENADG